MVNFRRFLLRSAALLGAAGTLAACGGTSGDGAADRGQVASLDRGATVSASPADVEAGRPRLRLDASDAESAQLYLRYKKCLQEHGATDVDTGSAAGPAGADGSMTANREATAACLSKQPLPPAELDPATNPNLAAQWNDFVRCQRKGGVMMHVTDPGQEEWDPGAGDIDVDLWQRVDAACLKQVFS